MNYDKRIRIKKFDGDSSTTDCDSWLCGEIDHHEVISVTPLFDPLRELDPVTYVVVYRETFVS